MLKNLSPLFARSAVALLLRIGVLAFAGIALLLPAAAQEVCGNGTDDDADGLIDCEDPECAEYSTCEISPVCNDPFQYYMPPVYGNKTFNCSSYGEDDVVISTNGGTATVKIYAGDGTLLQTLIAPVANPVYFTLPSDPTAGHDQILNSTMNTVMSSTGLIISSDQPLQVTYRQLSSAPPCNTHNQDIMQIHGQAALGYSFYPASQTYISASNLTYNGVFEKHFVSVMATENSTQVTFTIPAGMQMEGSADHTTNVTPDWTGTRTITLNRGQSYIIATRNEAPNVSVSGIKVTADKPIVVNSGSQHTRQPQNGDGDAGLQQIIPTQSTGRTYAILDGGNATNVKDYLIIIGIKNNTALKINGVSGATDATGTIMPATINAGQVVQYVMSDVVYAPYIVDASQNVYCYHISSYGTGEFGMELMPPLDFCIGNKKIDFDKPGTTAKAIVYVPTAGLPSLRFRGLPYTSRATAINGNLANPIGTTGYSFVVFEDANIDGANNNRVTCNEKIAVGVLSRTGGTGNYAFYSSYIRDVEVYDPITGQPTLAYTAGTVTPGVPITHCMSIGGCGANNSIISLTADAGGTVTQTGPTCFSYSMNAAATPCFTENISVEVQNEFGIRQKICVKFNNEISNVTLSATLPPVAATCIGGTIYFDGTATSVATPLTYLWTTPMGTQVTTPELTVSGATTANAGWYSLEITDAGGCVLEKLVNVPVYNCTNFDVDGVTNANDPDDDDDGILDVRETCGPLAANYSCLNTVIHNGSNIGLDPTADEDNDGTMNLFDASDDDGGGDFVNTCADVSPADGLCDAINPMFDKDGDDFPDFWDLDADNDGIPDVIEVGGIDTDGNGIIDGTDGNNDGIINVATLNGLILLDSDQDGLPNTLDLDSDNDGLSDRFEVGGTDLDSDGLVDNFATNGSGFANLHDPAANGVPLVFTGSDTDANGYANTFPFSDADGDGRQNYLDVDSDNDGITDLAEAGGADFDGDGRVDVLADNPTEAFTGAEDANNNGWTDIHDSGSPLPALDHDSDGFRSHLDRDSDDDGIPDIIEAGGTDATGDGVVDVFADLDNDGLADLNDPEGDAYNITVNTGNATSQATTGSVTNAGNATGAVNGGLAVVTTGATITLNLGTTVTAGGTIMLYMKYNSAPDAVITVETAPDGVSFSPIATGVVVDNATIAAYPYNLTANATHVRITVTGARSLDLDAVTYLFTAVAEPAIAAGNPLLLTGADAGADGLPDSFPNDDKDQDNVYNFLDLDSDNDGLTDISEAGGADLNGDGRGEYTTFDYDNDGYADNYDPDDDGIAGTDATAGESTQPLVLTGADAGADGIADDGELALEGNGTVRHDSDNDGLVDWLDLDSDNDGLTDLVEANGTDTNGDGLVDHAGTFASNDTDNDGYLDLYDSDDDGFLGTDTGESTQPLILATADASSNGKIDGTDAQTRGDGLAHDLDGDGRQDFLDLDADNDAITDLIEAGGIDTDGDGLVDGYTDGADNDGYVSIYDTDDNNDGTPETATSALVQTSADVNANGKVDNAEGFFAGNGTTTRDTDGDTRPDFVDLDSDNDGIADVVEAGGADADGNGYVDGYTDGTDTDGYNSANDPDDANDGTMETPASPLVLTAADGNANGLADLATEFLTDGNGLVRQDFDRDGRANWLDLDADNDGITDVREAGGASADPDNNGIIGSGASAAINDPNGDGFSSTTDGKEGGVLLATPNSDATGGYDFLDIDADDDGIVDNVEGQSTAGYTAPTSSDTDGDGLDDQYDAVVGWAGAGIIAVNTDGSDNPDYRDSNSDNDADNDRNEGWDSDNVGGPDVVYAAPDSDGDGLVDAYDNDDANVNPTNGSTPASHPDFDNPGGDRDWREGSSDADGDGVPDAIDLDDDNDGIADTEETGSDSDGDGIPNWFDLDSDDDGITDLTEAGGLDSDGDGRVDALQTNANGTFTVGQDSDNDGWWDMYDNTGGSFTTGSPLPLPNSDGTGPADWLDLDSDDDGIVDLIEAGGADLDGDGTVDNTLDVDGDGYYDFYDSDNDGTFGVDAGSATQPLVRTSADSNNDGLRNDSELLLDGTASINQDTDRDLLPDWLDVDSDNDGLTDIVEAAGTDSDGDGRVDGYTDTDGDGYSDNRDPDDDGISGTDSGESTQPLVRTTTDANANGKVDNSEMYTRGDGSTNQDTDLDLLPNFIDLDSDNDGLADIIEAGGIDSDGNGWVDYSGAFASADTDGDGLLNTYDTSNGGTTILNRNSDGDAIPNYLDLDSDNDGLADIIEESGTDANNNGRVDFAGAFVLSDTDNDGWINTYDGDQNNDQASDNLAAVLVLTSASGTNGVPVSYARGDFDADGKYNAIDLDADNDGANDLREATTPATFAGYDGILTADIDGVVSSETGLTIPDTDGDGWANLVDSDNGGTAINPVNTDGTGFANFLDIDSDDDGIVDIVELQTSGSSTAISGTDADSDGIDDNRDGLVGWGGAGLTPTNTDGGDNTDYLDTDSDNDGKNDRLEGWDDNGNGAIFGSERVFTGVDADADGLDDGYDNNTAAVNTNNGTTSNSHPDVNNPGGNRDWRQAQDRDRDGIVDGTDLDDDNDGIPDTAENGGTSPAADSDGDGILNLADASTCTGSINTLGVCTTFDKDGDGIVNQWDLDADDDGIPDLIEAGGVDTDGNGLVDALNTDADYTFSTTSPNTDTDNDGWWDVFDNTGGGVTTGTNLTLSDTDGDGIADYLDLDSDNDGITDLIEARGVDANGDGKVDIYTDVNLNGFTDVYDPNTDLDYANETDTNPLIRMSADVNADGRADDGELRYRSDGTTHEDIDTDGIAAWLDLDADNDGIPDLVEVGGADDDNDGRVDVSADPEQDGYANIYDSDDNNDGTVESATEPLLLSRADANADGKLTAADGAVSTWYPLESSSDQNPADTDQDGLPNAYDLDSDNDGMPDALEVNAGAVPTGNYNSQGQITSFTADANADGWDDGKDGVEVILDPANDADSDGIADEGYAVADDFDSDRRSDAYDIDADNDGILDADEMQPSSSTVLAVNVDTDGDGIDDGYDPNNGGTIVAAGNNNDASDRTDYLDTDSDNDGSFDWIEGFDDNDADVDALDEYLAKMNDWRSAFCPGAANCGVYINTTDDDSDGFPAWTDPDDATSDNNNGTAFIPPFLDATNTTYFFDTDKDGLADIFDLPGGGASTEPDNGVSSISAQAPAASTVLTPDYRDAGVATTYPVEWLSFEARAAGNDARLDWATASELNNAYFEVERSLDGHSFSVAGQVAGAGTTQAVTPYLFVDKGVAPLGTLWYRLHQVDLDGQSSYSEIRSVRFAQTPALSLAPNPAREQCLATVSLPQGISGTLRVVDMLGRVMYTATVGESSVLDLPLDGLAAGVYTAELLTENLSVSARLVIE